MSFPAPLFFLPEQLAWIQHCSGQSNLNMDIYSLIGYPLAQLLPMEQLGSHCFCVRTCVLWGEMPGSETWNEKQPDLKRK